ncbi:GNAT family N-acetyltransferase, partial [bacterium]|nr:GNAT family N-acetyltransferase [bacterium]
MTIAIFKAQTPQEREDVYRFRYLMIAIGDEHEHLTIDHKQRLIYDEHDADAIILYAKRDTKIVGTIRILDNTRTPLPKHLIDQFNFSDFEKTLKPHELSFTDHFFLDPTMRGQTLASLVVSSAFHIMLHKKIKASITFVHTRMIPHYRRLGYRQIDKSLRLKHEITYVPMVLCLNDYSHLLQVMSPLALSLSEENDDQ